MAIMVDWNSQINSQWKHGRIAHTNSTSTTQNQCRFQSSTDKTTQVIRASFLHKWQPITPKHNLHLKSTTFILPKRSFQLNKSNILLRPPRETLTSLLEKHEGDQRDQRGPSMHWIRNHSKMAEPFSRLQIWSGAESELRVFMIRFSERPLLHAMMVMMLMMANCEKKIENKKKK